MDKIADLKSSYLDKIALAEDEQSLEEVRLAALGKRGEVALMLRNLGGMTPSERLKMGPLLNSLKDDIRDAVKRQKDQLAKELLNSRLQSEWIDISRPCRPKTTGSIHPVSQVTDEVIAIFSDLGFSVAEGPQIESDYYNFDALNIPADHPARQEFDTFYLPVGNDSSTSAHVLRTHTSPVQIRYMEKEGVPCRIIAPGRVFRSDYDLTHTPMFHQVEGLAIDKDISMANLKWTLEEFCRVFFEVKTVELRFRSSHFPFTEPSAEVDIKCTWKGNQLKIGEGEDWMEILGSGMVHPKVLSGVGVDPSKYQGFAFGLGIDRIAMLKYGIPDLRSFFDSDLRWLEHYGFSPSDEPSIHKGISR